MAEHLPVMSAMTRDFKAARNELNNEQLALTVDLAMCETCLAGKAHGKPFVKLHVLLSFKVGSFRHLRANEREGSTWS